MNTIDNGLFFHIQTDKHWKQNVPWQVGETHFIGQTKNSFLDFFDHTSHAIEVNQRYVSVNDVSREMLNFLETGAKAPFFNNFHYDSKEMIKNLHFTLESYLKLSREHLFEEVRSDYFASLPSRIRCLWVIEPDEDNKSLKYWYNQLGQGGRIYKLNLTGKIHKVNQEFLTINTNNMNYIRQQAFKYWSGASGAHQHECEILFEGLAIVEEQLDPRLLGLG